MTSMEDRLLGNKTDNYISDDEEREEDGNAAGNQNGTDSQVTVDNYVSTFKTGPKGVIEDYRRYKELDRQEKEQREKEKMEIIKKSALTCSSTREDEELENLDDDEFLREYHEMRLQQLKREAEQSINSKRARFGKVTSITGRDFVDAIDKEEPSVSVIVHIYELNVAACIQMNKCLDCLAQQYPQIKFCKVLASEAGLSLKFKLNALPTLQVYQDGMLVGNFLKLTDELEDEFFAADVENFLLEKGLLSSTPMSGISKPIRGLKPGESLDSSEDSDLGLD